MRVTEDIIVLEKARFAEGIVIGGMESTDIREVHILLDPGMDLTARQEEEGKLESRFPCAEIVGKLLGLAGMTRPYISCIVLELGRRILSS